MNRYGQVAREHWSRFLPSRYAAIEDPLRFFTELGREVQDRVTTLETQLAGVDPVGETHLQKVGRLTGARARAEETALRELVLLPAEPGSPMDEDDEETEPTTTSSTGGWHPVAEDPRDPFWATVDR